MRRDGGVSVFVVLLLLGPVRGEPPGRVDAYGDPLPEGAILRIGTARFREGFEQDGCALSPDGKIWATVEHRKTIYLWDTATGRKLRDCGRVTAAIWAPKFSADGKSLAGVGGEEKEKFGFLWDAASGKELCRIRLPGSEETRRGPFLVEGISFAAGYVLEEGQGFFLRTIPAGKTFGPFAALQKEKVEAALSPDGRLLATWGYEEIENRKQAEEIARRNRTVQLWDVQTGTERCRLLLDRSRICTVTFSPDSRSVAVVSDNKEIDPAISLWEVATAKVRLEIQAPEGLCRALRFSPDGRTLAAGAGNKVYWWETETGRRLGISRGPEAWYTEAVFTPQGRFLAYALVLNGGERPHVWDIGTGKILTPATGTEGNADELTFLKQGSILATCNSSERKSWDIPSGKERPSVALATVRTRERDLSGPGALSRSGKWYAVPKGGRLHLWELAEGAQVFNFDRSWEFGYPIFSADDSRLAAVCRHEIAVWDVATGQRKCLLTLADEESPYRLALSPDGKIVAAAGENEGGDPFLRLWDVGTGEVIRSIETREVTKLAFSDDGQLLAARDDCGGIDLWDPTSGKFVRRLEGAIAVYRSRLALDPMVFSPDGRSLACVGEPVNDGDTVVLLFDVRTGELRRNFAGHRGWILSLAFSPDGKRLASSATDTTVLLWDLTTPAKTSK